MIFSLDIVDQRILQSDWTRRTYPSKSGSLRCYLALTAISIHKTIYRLFDEVLRIKEACSLIDQTDHTQPKVVLVDALLQK